MIAAVAPGIDQARYGMAHATAVGDARGSNERLLLIRC
jgi:hypothetical protein